MKIYLKKHDEKKRINIKDVVYFTSQLEKFINVYSKMILFKNDNVSVTSIVLKQILQLFKQQKYDYLFKECIDNIDFDPDNVNFTDEEIEAWEAFFGKQS